MTIPMSSTYKVLDLPKHTFDRIAFYGPMAAGKSWCASELQWHGYGTAHLASKLKTICYDLYGIQGKDNRSRRILQEVSDDLKKWEPHLWVKYLLNSLKSHEKDKIVVDDLRFVHEAKYFRENGFNLVLVTADNEVRAKRIADLYPDTDPSRHLHASEQEWKEIEPDFANNSTGPDAATQLERMLADVTYRPRWKK